MNRYFKRRVSKGPKLEKDEDNSDLESVASEEFEQYMAENADVDFAADMKAKPKAGKKAKKRSGDEDEESDEEEDGNFDDLEAAEMDSEDDFGQDEDFQDAFKEFDDMLDDVTVPGTEQDEDKMDDEDGEIGFNEEDVEFSEGNQISSFFFKFENFH